MRNAALIVSLAMLLCARSIAEDAKRESPRQVLIKIRVLSGNPCGKGENEAPKVIAEPKLHSLTGPNGYGSYRGGTPARTISVEFRHVAFHDGMVDLELTRSTGKVELRPQNVQQPNGQTTTTSFGFIPEDGSTRSRQLKDLPLGKKIKFRLQNSPGELREWVEISVEEFEEVAPPPVVPQKPPRPRKSFLA